MPLRSFLKRRFLRSDIMLSKTVTLTNDQIKDLATTPVKLISNTNPNKDFVLLSGRIFLDASAGAYTNLTNFSYMALCLGLPTPELDIELSSKTFTSSGSRWAQQRKIWADLIQASFRFVDVDNDGPYSPPESDQFITPGGNDLYLGLIGATNGNWTGGHADNFMRVTIIYTLIDV